MEPGMLVAVVIEPCSIVVMEPGMLVAVVIGPRFAEST